MLSFLVVIAGLGWSLFLIQRYGNRDVLRFPEVSSPVTPEEQRLREELAQVKSERDEARIRAKHAIQDKERAERDAAQVRLGRWVDIKKLRDIQRVLDRSEESEPVLAGAEERAG